MASNDVNANNVDFKFKSGLPDCCHKDVQPDSGIAYKVACEIPNKARLIEMTMAPGAQDKPHDHPTHLLYFVTDAKLEIQDFDAEGKPAGDVKRPEIPAGAAPIMPDGPHQVKNIGDAECKVVFLEPYPDCKPCGTIDNEPMTCDSPHSPFKTNPNCYTILEQNEDWVTGIMTMDPGQQDDVHCHRDHLIYVLEGGDIEIHPGGGDECATKTLPTGAGVPAPMSEPAFGKHYLKNVGENPIKMLFFEQKK